MSSSKTSVNRTVKVVKPTAAGAIDHVLHRTKLPNMDAPALAQLKTIVESNDKQTNHMRRVGWHTAVEVCQAHGWEGSTFPALNRVCREQMGRTSYAQP